MFKKFERSKSCITICIIGGVDRGKIILAAAISAILAVHNANATKKFDEIDSPSVEKV